MAHGETARLEAFSDGVFAIAITLLVLEFKVPDVPAGAGDARLLAALAGLWPSGLAYLMSFAAILIMWVNHHAFFGLVRRADARLSFANGFLLLCVTFVPFPTAVLAHFLARDGARAAAVFYCGTYVAISLAYNLLAEAAFGGRALLHAGVTPAQTARIRGAYRGGFVVYAAAAAAAYYHPYAGLAVCNGLWAFWALLRYRAD